jgi:hypothetical protein
MGNICAFPHILGSPSSSDITLKLLHSLYMRKFFFYFLSVQPITECLCGLPRANTLIIELESPAQHIPPSVGRMQTAGQKTVEGPPLFAIEYTAANYIGLLFCMGPCCQAKYGHVNI